MDWFLYDRDLRYERVKQKKLHYLKITSITLQQMQNVSFRLTDKPYAELITIP